REMLGPSCIAGSLGSRFRGYFDPLFGYRLNPACNMYYGRPRTPGRPLVLIVSPYAVYPPAHGGARRIHELISRLSSEFDTVVPNGANVVVRYRPSVADAPILFLGPLGRC